MFTLQSLAFVDYLIVQQKRRETDRSQTVIVFTFIDSCFYDARLIFNSSRQRPYQPKPQETCVHASSHVESVNVKVMFQASTISS